MKFSSFTLSVTGLLFLASACLMTASEPDKRSKALPAEPMKKGFSFSLLPKAFQKNPLLAITVITELTDEGKKLKLPTAANPTYYVVVPAGYHHEGEGTSQEKTLSVEYLEKEVKKSLAISGYLESSKDHPPTLVLFFVWGVHAKLAENDKNTGDGGVEDIGYRNLLSRATLVGGRAFAEELQAVLEEQNETPTGDQLTDPLNRFIIRSEKNRSLWEQIRDDCYYVVVSAYDGAAISRGEKKLLWRTKMTTAAQGVSLAETSTALAASGGPYFGREMTEPSIIDKRISRNGKVELGETRTISMDEPSPVDEKKETKPAKK